MGKKSFYLCLGAVVFTFIFTLLIRFYRPQTAGNVDFDNFPMKIGEWRGERDTISPDILGILNPQAIVSATYTNPEGISVHLLCDFFSSEATFGGPHSPRNCLPGSGWTITGTESNSIEVANRIIPAGRFQLQLDQFHQVMDFWYITHMGETANDYVFKLYELLSALTFKPRDIAFVRFVAKDDPESLAALKEFQKLSLKEIYQRLPFEK